MRLFSPKTFISLPAAARTIAAQNPLGPEPMIVAVVMWEKSTVGVSTCIPSFFAVLAERCKPVCSPASTLQPAPGPMVQHEGTAAEPLRLSKCLALVLLAWNGFCTE